MGRMIGALKVGKPISKLIGRPGSFGGGDGAYAFLPGLDIDMNFALSTYRGKTPTDLVCVRASLAWTNDATGNWAQAANNVSRITNLGLKIEEARTNSIRNNSAQGAIVGVPGTLPTNWIQAANAGLQWNVAGTGTENGIDYVDMQLVGTSGGAGVSVLYFEGVTQIAASVGQVWTTSMFSRISAGSIGALTFALGAVYYNSVPAVISDLVTAYAPLTTGILGNQRFSNSQTAPAATASTEPHIIVQDTGGPVNITLRIGWPQHELGTWATTPMKTTAGAFTRSSDNVKVSCPTPAGGLTFYASAIFDAPVTFGANQFFGEISDGSTANRFGVLRVLTAGNDSTTNTGGSVPSTGQVIAQNALTKVALSSIVGGNANEAMNGALATPSASAAGPVGLNIIALGQRADATGVVVLNGFLRRAGMSSTGALTGAQLQDITSLNKYN